MTTYEQRITSKAEEFARASYPIVTDMEINNMRPLAVIAVEREMQAYEKGVIWGLGNVSVPTNEASEFISKSVMAERLSPNR